MAQTLIARGQATITIQKDGYTITQSLGEYIFPADQSGKILSAVSVTSTISVTLGDSAFTNFTIGTITKPTGFSSISVNNTNKTVTFAVAANTTTLADHGKVEIPIVISGTTYKLTFVWSKAKKGDTGAAGVDANLLDWVKEWNTGKTLINSNTVITPKLFAGAKNTDGTISGIAIGSFALTTLNLSYSTTFPFPHDRFEKRQKPRVDQAEIGAEAYNGVVSIGWIGEKEIYLLFRLYAQDF